MLFSFKGSIYNIKNGTCTSYEKKGPKKQESFETNIENMTQFNSIIGFFYNFSGFYFL